MKSYLQSNGYVFNQDDGLWHRPEYEGIKYTDGDKIENRLKAIVSGANDVSVMSIELAKCCTDWPSLYHLSRVRVNLLRPFEERLQGKSVLEVGSGCGALTRYLGELGAEVVALEGSLRRASIVASRCRGLNNITVVGEVVHHFHPGPQFDVVTLIGVLEYARKFFPGNGADPVDAMLGYVRELLKPGGTLIVAIENQLGLKYFAGFAEDHVGKSMFGIEEHYSQDGVVTFGRRELARRVGKVGLTEQEWWYPFPDYKLPSLMVSESGALPSEGIDLTPVLRSASINDPQSPPCIQFNQERALRPIVRNGLLGEVANSFVLLASDIACSDKPNIPLAVHFAAERRPEFAKKVVFTQAEHCVGYTSQVALYPSAKPAGNSLVIQHLVDQAFVKGELWQDRLIQIMTSPGWTVTQIEEWFKVWLDAFCDVVGIDKSCDMSNKKISGQYLDLIPRNMIMDEHGVPIFIDQEWVFGEELEVGYVVFRALFSSFYAIGGIAQMGERTLPSILCLIREIGQGLGFSLSDHEVKRYHNLECDFQQLVVGNSSLSYEVMTARQFRVSNTVSAHHGYGAEVHGQILVLKQALMEREKQIAILTQTVRDLNEQFIRLNRVLSEKEPPEKTLSPIIVSDGRNSLSGPTPPQLPHIVAIVNDPICSQIRILQALTAGAKKSWLRGTVKIEGAEGGHPAQLPSGPGTVWIVQRTCRIDISGMSIARSTGTRLVHDIDDLLWKIPEDNQNYHVVKKWLVDHMMRLLGLADCVTTSTIPLQAALERLGIKATVLPNCLVAEEWKNLEPQRRASSRPRVGWAGQVGVHRSDLHFLNSVFEDLGGEIEWVFLGEVPEGLRRTGIKSAVHPMVPLREFPKKLASLNLDLALAPLAVNEFNEAKSDLRLLQYGALGYPVIATDIYPHQIAPVTRVPNNPRAWARAIREHIYNQDCSEKKGQILREWVLEQRMLDYWLPQFRDVWMGEKVTTSDPSVLTGKGNNEPRSPTISYIPHVTTRYECSIIIPVFNKMELTRQCLTHLAEVTDGCSYEVIVVDNNSTDGTQEFLANLGGDIQVISNPENFGFSKACNQGAAAAKGRFLVFLNNDTIPKPGWLQALVDEVETHQDVAVVGSKLLYPDETIQHAGVVFSKNCLTPYHIFKGAPGDLHAANVRREFQVVTAACFLVRRKDFEGVGGFDEGFRNGFEDVDLCLKIRERGRKVIYQPKSTLYHLEHQTPGRKDPETERHNGNLLMSRWTSKIVVDEDLYTVPEGYANRYYFRDGWLRQSLEPFQSDEEKTQWNRVQRVQELLIIRRYDATLDLKGQSDRELYALLSDDREWPKDSEVLRWAARLCQSLKLLDEERAFLKQILNLGEDREAREQLAKIALNVKDLSEAAHHVQALLRSDPNDGSGYWFQGILLMQSQQCADAIISFRKAIRCGCDPRKASLGLGMACMGMGDAEGAWRIFERLVADHPDDAEVMNWLIQSGTSLQRWEGLGQRLSRYVERNPADCDMRFALAGVEYRANRMDSAKHQFEMLSLLKPGYEGLADLGVLLQTSRIDVPVLTP
jgi:GT2 family glycosyltransferase/thioredoxin-like negative regulator of GroEL/2-polyprenyl-3-methyl-5-hydroxy-6-metoxy-1,4-benzoquinol methylase